MPKGRGSKVGEARVDVTADTSQLKRGLDEARSDVNQFGTDAEAAGKKAGGAFEDVGSKIDGSTAGARKFSGAISGAVGAATALVGAFTAIVGLVALATAGVVALAKSLKDARSDTDKLADGLDKSVVNIEENIRATEAALQALQKRIEFLRENQNNPILTIGETGIGKSASERLRELEDEFDKLSQLDGELRRQRDRLNNADRKRQGDADFVALRALLEARENAARRAGMTEREIAKENAEKALEELERLAKRRQELGLQFTEDELKREKRRVEETLQRELDAIQRVTDERGRALDAQARAFQESMIDALRAIRDEQGGLFGSTGGSSAGIIAELIDIRSNLPVVPMQGSGQVTP